MPPKGSNEYNTLLDLIERIEHGIEEANEKLDAHGDRLTRVEIATQANTQRIEAVECVPTKKRENWKTWIAIIGGLLGVAAVVVPVLIALEKWFNSVKQVIGG